MSKNTSTTTVTPAATDTEHTAPEATPVAVTPTTTPVTASIPTGQKSPALFGGNFPVDWAGSRAIAVNSDGTKYAVLIATGDVHQGEIADISPRALAYGYALGARRKADADGAGEKNTQKGIDTAITLSGDAVKFSDWCAPRISGPREETATPLDLQLKTLLIAKLRPSKDNKGKLVWNTLTTAVKTKKIKLTGFSGTASRLFNRYFEVVKLVLDVEPTEEQIDTFKALNIAAAEKALAEAARCQAELAEAEDTPWA